MVRMLSQWSDGANAPFAPPPFVYDRKQVVPVKIAGLTMYFDLDVSQRRVVARCRVQFSATLRGYPLFDLVPNPLRLSLDGISVNPSQFPQVRPPGNEAFVRFLDIELDAEAPHILETEYLLNENDAPIVFADGGVSFGLFLNDLVDRGFLERYAPTNLEFDQFQMGMEIAISGSMSDHQLFSNGDIVNLGPNKWKIAFPEYFTCSSAYVHLTNRRFAVVNGSFRGQKRAVPVTVYGEDQALVTNELTHVTRTLEELESAYGPYTHKSMLVFVAQTLEPPLAGMEYCGATMTNPGHVLEHEITHSWFGRGVMPANGNAGWIDEAVARWRDNGYPRAAGGPNRLPVNLAGFSPYRRRTTRDAYFYGSLLLSEIDFLLANQGGLRPVLKSLFSESRHNVIDTPFFQAFLERQTGMNLDTIFTRYVYGRSGEDSLIAARDELVNLQKSLIPDGELAHRSYTLEELKRLI